MIQHYNEEGWNKHLPELVQEFRPCLFERGTLVQDCLSPSPTAEELCWLRETLLRLLGVRTVLDLGCGIGLFVGLFDGFDYVGVDLTPRMLEKASQDNPEKRFVRAHASRLTDAFPQEKFDLVFTRAVVQHNIEPEKSKIVQSISDILRSGGFYLFHEHQFILPNEAKTETEEYMQQFGFILLDYYPTSGYLFRKI